MTFRSCVLFLCPAVCLLAQTPPPQSAPPASPPASVQPSSPARVTIPPRPPMASVPPAPTVPPDRVVLALGDVKVTAAQFDSIIALLPPQSQANARGPGRKQFGDAVLRILALSEEARRRKMDQTPTFQLQSLFAVDNLLAGAAGEQLGKEVKVDDAELQKYYNDHLADFETAHARHILIRVTGSPVPLPPGRKELNDAEALAKAQEIRKKLEGGADFAALAKEESYDISSGANGGDLGAVRHGMMVGPFEQATFALKPGELSQPVKTQFGYHIIRLDSKETKTFGEEKPELERRMRPEMTQKAVEELVKKSNPVMDPEFFATAKQ